MVGPRPIQGGVRLPNGPARATQRWLSLFYLRPSTSTKNEQAAKSAKNYLDNSAFSRQGLIEQLSSEYGDGFTYAQAVYGVNQTCL